MENREVEWEVWDVVTTPFSKSRYTRSLPPAPRQLFHTLDKNSKETGCQQAVDQLPALYLILIAGAGVDAGVRRACGVRDF